MKMNKTLLALLMAKNSFGVKTDATTKTNNNNNNLTVTSATSSPLSQHQSAFPNPLKVERSSNIAAAASTDETNTKIITLSNEENTILDMMQYVEKEKLIRKGLKSLSVPIGIGLTLLTGINFALQYFNQSALTGEVAVYSFLASGIIMFCALKTIQFFTISDSKAKDLKLIKTNLRDLKLTEFEGSPQEKEMKDELDKLKSITTGVSNEKLEEVVTALANISSPKPVNMPANLAEQQES